VTQDVSSPLYWAKTTFVQIRKIIQRRIRGASDGLDFVGDVNAAIAANVGERSSTNRVSSRSSVTAKSVGSDEEERGDGFEARRRPER
jgi:hypothetical protein